MKKFLALVAVLAVMAINFSAQAAERNDDDFIGPAYRAYIVNCNEWVSLRYAPSTSSQRLVKIPLGTMVVVMDGPADWDIDGFLPVEYGGYKGYVLKKYLETIPYSGGDAGR